MKLNNVEVSVDHRTLVRNSLTREVLTEDKRKLRIDIDVEITENDLVILTDRTTEKRTVYKLADVHWIAEL